MTSTCNMPASLALPLFSDIGSIDANLLQQQLQHHHGGIALPLARHEHERQKHRRRMRRGRTYDKICTICGDRAHGLNFSVVSCESCKAFFRRWSLSAKTLKCAYRGRCTTTVGTRGQCKKCRMFKCFESGMTPLTFEHMQHQPACVRRPDVCSSRYAIDARSSCGSSIGSHIAAPNSRHRSVSVVNVTPASAPSRFVDEQSTRTVNQSGIRESSPGRPSLMCQLLAVKSPPPPPLMAVDNARISRLSHTMAQTPTLSFEVIRHAAHIIQQMVLNKRLVPNATIINFVGTVNQKIKFSNIRHDHHGLGSDPTPNIMLSSSFM